MEQIKTRFFQLAGVIILALLVMFQQQFSDMIKEWRQKTEMEKQETAAPAEPVLSTKKEESEKIAYLTFDDGPSANTDKILDILKEKGVKATFFVVGKEGEQAKARYQRILDEGHSLGLHTYSHNYEEIYASLSAFQNDVKKLQNYLYEVIGQRIRIYRFPGGSSNSVSKVPVEDMISYLKEEGIEYFDWNASSEDAVLTGAECAVLNQNVLKDALLYKRTMILMHDLSTCTGTVDGLSDLIDRMHEEGYGFQEIDEDTVPVHHR